MAGSWTGPNGTEGLTVYRPDKHVDGNRFGARVVDVRATEVDIKMYEGGTWKVFTVARSMAPGVIAKAILRTSALGGQPVNVGQRPQDAISEGVPSASAITARRSPAASSNCTALSGSCQR